MARSIKNLIASVLIAISGYLAWMELLPDYMAAEFLKTLIAEKTELIASRTEIINRIEELRNESSSKYTELQRLALVLPQKKSLPEIITAIEAIYSSSGLVLPEINLGEADRVGQLGKINFLTSSRGTYEQMLILLKHLEKNIRLFDIFAFSVGIDKTIDGNLENSNPVLNFSITGSFYILAQDTPPQNSTGGASVEE